MPRAVYGPEHPFLARAELLSFEEIERLARIFVGLGVRKLRLTGGEPLLRRDLPELIRRLVPLGVPIALTTNGSLLRVQAAALRRAGLTRLTVSLDTLDPVVFRRMNDAEFGPQDVLAGIAAAEAAGFDSIKINAVVRRGVNEDAVGELTRKFRGSAHVLRFIEYMDVGESNGWRLEDVVPAAEILRRITAASAIAGQAAPDPPDPIDPLVPIAPSARGEVARALPVSRRLGRDRHHLVRVATLLRRLRPRPPVGGRQDLHLSVRHELQRHQGSAARRSERRAAGGEDFRDLARALRPLLGAALAGDSRLAPPGRDVVHRGLIEAVRLLPKFFRELLEQRVEGGARILRHRRGLLGGEFLALAGLELGTAVRFRLPGDELHLRLPALRRRPGIEVGAVGAGVQIGSAAGAPRGEAGRGGEALQLATAGAAKGARGRRAETAAAWGVARIARPSDVRAPPDGRSPCGREESRGDEPESWYPLCLYLRSLMRPVYRHLGRASVLLVAAALWTAGGGCRRPEPARADAPAPNLEPRRFALSDFLASKGSAVDSPEALRRLALRDRNRRFAPPASQPQTLYVAPAGFRIAAVAPRGDRIALVRELDPDTTEVLLPRPRSWRDAASPARRPGRPIPAPEVLRRRRTPLPLLGRRRRHLAARDPES